MNIIYAQEDLTPAKTHKSVFLAGPTVRSSKSLYETIKTFPRTKSWRPEAIKLFREFPVFRNNGVLLVPEAEKGKFNGNYRDQIEWEDEALSLTTTIMFWIPRNLKDMPAFTTNVEFGRWMDSGKVVLGVPPNAPKCNYLIWYAKKLKIPLSDTLKKCISDAIYLTFYI